MRVLFVSGIDGPCHRYQVLHRAAQLRRRGAAVQVCSFRAPHLAEAARAVDLLFLYRVPATGGVRAAIDAARAGDARVVGSIDDLLFVPDADALPPLAHLSPAERELWRRGVERYGATLAACDAFVGPTESLVEEAARLGWDARLHRNSIARAELALAEAARARAPRRRGEVVLGYFSGTPTHDADFASVAAALVETLRRHLEVRLCLVGPLRPPESLSPWASRIERRPAVTWAELVDLVAAVDVSLAPIELGRRFAAAKGDVKYIEAAAVGRPIVASPTAAFRHATRDGTTGLLAGAPEEWCDALDRLVRDEELRRALGEAARADLLERWTEERRADELVRALDGVGRRREDARGWDAAFEADAAAEAPAALALEPDACPALAHAEIGAASPPLGEGRRLAQAFRCGRDGLCRVDVHTITYGQDLRHELRLTVRRADGATAGLRIADAAEAPDRGWFAVELPPEPRSAGATYELELEARGTGPGNAVSFGLAAPADGGDGRPAGGATGIPVGAARLGGEPLAAPLALRAFAAWDHALGGRSAVRGTA